MYAIVEIKGKQYKVEKDATIDVDALNATEGGEIIFDKILLLANGDKVMIGQPYLENVKITAHVVGALKGEKVRGVKFGKRKRYERTLGHRRRLSRLQIKELSVT